MGRIVFAWWRRVLNWKPIGQAVQRVTVADERVCGQRLADANPPGRRRDSGFGNHSGLYI
ncbi:hypothetical protein [Paenibacillus herberti]|uniref:hypothetical protein n=1 Tax=Paenibacillus herberti TaxID=1619309 RepID=UPI0011317667|nr:hypothetical protein [Paenibacillus herberti]